jgi:hypothetical protein
MVPDLEFDDAYFSGDGITTDLYVIKSDQDMWQLYISDSTKYSTKANSTKQKDSVQANLTSGLVLKKNILDSGYSKGPTAYATVGLLAKVRDSLPAGGGGSGTVTSASVVSANGFAGSVATSTTTPAITLSTTITGMLKGNGTAISAATAGTDYTTPSSTETFTNKRWTPRVGSTTSSATPTINTDNYDIYKITAQTADITSFTTNLTGTPVDGDILELQVTGTAARAITWGASFVSSTVTLPTTTVTTATLSVVFQYFTTSSYGNNKWVCVNSF